VTKQERQQEVSSRFHHIGDVAALTGLSADALRAWEDVGLLMPQRSAGGVRQYTEDDIARVRLIARTLQRGGFSRAAVAMLLRSGDLQPDAADYAPGPTRVRRAGQRIGAPGADIVDDRHSDRRMLEAVARISNALASGRALSDVLEVICSETCGAFGVSDSILWLAAPPSDGGDMRVVVADPTVETSAYAGPPRALFAVAACGQHWGLAPLGSEPWRTIPLDDAHFPPAQAFLTRRSVVVTTQDISARVHPELARMTPGAAFMCMPLLAAGSAPVGVLGLREALNAERFGEDDLERIRLFAVQASLAIQTARLHTAIQAAQLEADNQRMRWQIAIDVLPALVCICDTALRATYISPTCRAVLGWPAPPRPGSDLAELPTEWVTHQGFFWLAEAAPVADSLPPDELPLPRALREHQPVHNITVVHRRDDGTNRLISWDAAPMPDASGQVLGAIAFGRDVTLEHRLREREASLAAVAHAATATPVSGGVERHAVRILRALVENTQSPMMAATLYLLDEQAGVLRRVGAVGGERSSVHAPAVPITPQHPWWPLLVAGPVYSAHDRERPRWLRTIGLATWKASSLRAWASVPLRTGGILVGALVIGLGTPHVWDAAERTWLEACAAAITMAIENGRLLSAEGDRSRT